MKNLKLSFYVVFYFLGFMLLVDGVIDLSIESKNVGNLSREYINKDLLIIICGLLMLITGLLWKLVYKNDSNE